MLLLLEGCFFFGYTFFSRAAEGSCSQHLLGYRGIVLKAI